MSDALSLPDRPNLEYYRKLAKDFQHAVTAGTPDAIRDWAAAWLDRKAGADPGDAGRVERTWQHLVKAKPALADGSLTDAQFFIARLHGFASWPMFATHIESLSRANSGTAIFESAVDAIVGGDAATLARLLREHPHLVRERSARDHHATLLHYVSANGVEDFRQNTPKNIVEIARMLLTREQRNAESNFWRHDTTFGLAANRASEIAAFRTSAAAAPTRRLHRGSGRSRRGDRLPAQRPR